MTNSRAALPVGETIINPNVDLLADIKFSDVLRLMNGDAVAEDVRPDGVSIIPSVSSSLCIEDIIPIVSMVFYAWQGLCYKYTEQKNLYYLPTAWYLKQNDVVHTSDGKGYRIINIVKNPDGGIYFNKRYYLCCGQIVELDGSPDLDTFKHLILPKKALVPLTPPEPPESRDVEQPQAESLDLARCLVVGEFLSAEPIRGAKGQQSPGDLSEVVDVKDFVNQRTVRSERLYTFRVTFKLTMYAHSITEFNAASRYLREFFRLCGPIFTSLGLQSFIMKDMSDHQATNRRNSEISPIKPRLHSRQMITEVMIQEIVESSVPILKKIDYDLF